MSKRWQHKVVEVKPGMMGSIKTERVQEELDKAGNQGWELVTTLQQGFMVILYFKKEQ